MFHTKNLCYLACLVLFFCTQFVSGQLSKVHFIPPLTNSEFGNANPQDQYLYISTPTKANVNYTVIPVGQPVSSQINGTVTNDDPDVISLGSGYGQLFMQSTTTSRVTKNRGYIIESEAPVYVSVRMNAGGAQAGAIVSKGISALGTVFRIGSYTNENPQDNYLNFVSVMASEDDTEVTFDDLPSGLIIKNYSGPTPVTVTLNEGESYTIATNSDETPVNRDGLIGTLVSSTKPIAVNCGSANGSFHNGGGRDYGIDQIAGLSKIGNEYIFVKGGGNNDWENVLIVGHTNNTAININGNGPIATIDAGEYYLIEGGSYSSNGNMYVETSNDVFVYQGVGATSSEANQGMFFVPPLSCETRGNIDNIASIDRIGTTSYSGGLTIVTKTGADVTINNLPISNFSVIGPRSVTGNSDYVTYKVSGLTGDVSVQGDDELYVAYFNENNAATTGGFYSGFPSAPEINFNAQFVTLGNCIPNVTLEAANAQNFDTFEWWFDDGTGFINLYISSDTLTPNEPGRYQLIGTITCTGERLESAIIPVSICPDDIDNDGIIDNIDIDNDNDGIVNCTESNGDVTLDLSNSRPPILRFQDGSAETTFATNSIALNTSGTDVGSMQLTQTGQITSSIPADGNAENSYNISFDESVNIQFSENTSSPHNVVENESFIVSILPSNKNITLIDPDNRLLIDSNFDGLYESGVNMISGSEIRFRVNPSPNGTTPYKFLANQVTGFTLIHRLANMNLDSQYSGIISLTCFKKDSDLDGIKDELDLDSDNDGLPDFIENQGVFLPLSGVDENFDGLDDIYDVSLLPIDSDTDGVVDFYDLDSDNDGIYDVQETGQLETLFTDANVDGIVDGGSFGTNGWIDNAETNPDSNLIGYSPNNEDGDDLFSYIDLDSDGDDCFDVIEAGFSDNNNDGLLGDTAATVNSNGVVNNANDGYTLPNDDYLLGAPISIISQSKAPVFCEGSLDFISVDSPEADQFQWEVSTDGINWTIITDNTLYSNASTPSLGFSNIPLSIHNYQYRLKLDRTGNSCGIYSEIIIVTVNPQPIINSPVILVQCDDDDLGSLGFSPFNLKEAEDEISSNAANEEFSYYLSEVEALDGDENSSGFITEPIAFTNRTINEDTVWARIESAQGCVSVSEIQLKVSTTVIPSTFLETFNKCDDYLDAENDNKDGIATFNFSSVTDEILKLIPPGQNPLPPRYYRNETDALAEQNAITDIENYRNIGYPNSQYIYVRIDSDIANDCLGLGPYVLLNVEALPIANPVTIERQCDLDNDGFVDFDTSTIQSQLLGDQDNADVTISYFDEAGNVLPSPLPNPFATQSQTITARLVNNVTSDPDGPCYDETEVVFTVDFQPTANPLPPQIVCDGDKGDINDDGLFPFDTSNFSNTILQNNDAQAQILYSYRDENGIDIEDSPDLPNPFISSNQDIFVEVINPNNLNCLSSTTISLVVNPLPEFSVESPRIVCSSDPNFIIDLEPIEADSSEQFTYTWYWTSLDNSTTDEFLSNDRLISVSNPGTYTIELAKTDGTGCALSKEIFVDASEKATITLDDVTIVDFTENNTVTIDPTNLGMGTYDYALVEENSSIITYQEDPEFTYVRPGFYTIYVRDHICGVETLDISVIGGPRYFTPNGDGINDFWTVKGLSSSVQPNTTIHIYDRYGKLLKQVPVASNGWDGTLNGSVLPTDDYWYKVFLEDGRIISGHFTLKR